MTQQPSAAPGADPGATTSQAPADALARALIEEAGRKSGLIWLTVGQGPPCPAWHVWHDDAVYVVGGGAEQVLPELDDGATVTVTVRSKDKGGRLVSWTARARPLAPGDEEWEAVVPELHAKRLNAPDGEHQPARWVRESQITRLEPTGQMVEQPGAMSDGSHAAPPRPSPAVTLGRLPMMIGRKRGSRKRGGRKA